MADKKISQLTSATTPLAGTEVLPIVQGGVTVKVATLDVTGGVYVGRGAGAIATNTAVGASALAANTSGSGNTAIGYTAGASFVSGVNSTAIGSQTLNATTGNFNTGVGNGAGYYLSSGVSNTLVGYHALLGQNGLTTGSYNVAIGDSALSSNTTASNNTAVGYQAGYSNTTGGNNTAGGFQALNAGTTASNNTAFGFQAAATTTTGAQLVAFGERALYLNTTGNYNAAFGAEALHNNTTASNNTAVGHQAGYSNTTGAYSTFLGFQAGFNATTGTRNLAIGAFAGSSLTTGTSNVFVGGVSAGSGNGAGRFITTGSKNTILGSYDGNQGGLDIRTANNYIVLSDGDGNPRQVIDGSGNLGLGVTPSAWGTGRGFDLNTVGGLGLNQADTSLILTRNAYWNSGGTATYKTSATPANYFALVVDGSFAWGSKTSGTAGNPVSFGNPLMTLDASGNLLVGKTSTSQSSGGTVLYGSGTQGAYFTGVGSNAIYLNRETSDGIVVDIRRAAETVGTISVTTTNTAYNTTSDYRLKDNQQALTGSGAFIDALKPKTWTWKADGSTGVGFIAHEFAEVSPSSVSGEKDATEIQSYEVSPAVPAVLDADGVEVTPAVAAVMGEREVPKYQGMQASSSEVIANLVAEIQDLRKRLAAAGI